MFSRCAPRKVGKEEPLFMPHPSTKLHPHTCCIQAVHWVNRDAYVVWRSRRTFSMNVRTWAVFSAPLHVFPSLNDEPTITASAAKKSSMLPTAIPDPSNTGTVACALSSVITNDMCPELGSAPLPETTMCTFHQKFQETTRCRQARCSEVAVAVTGKGARRLERGSTLASQHCC